VSLVSGGLEGRGQRASVRSGERNRMDAGALGLWGLKGQGG